VRIRRLGRPGSDEARRRLVIWNPVSILRAGRRGIASVTAVRISGFIDQISNAIGFNVTVLQAYSLAGIRTRTQRQVALLAWRCIVNQDRCRSRQHIVRVLRGTLSPAPSLVSAGFGFRWCPWLFVS